MENLEKLLPLLIIAASFIFSIVSSSKKAQKKQEKAATPPVQKPVKIRIEVEPRASEPKKVEPVRSRPLLPEEVEPVFSSLPSVQLKKDEPQEIKLQEDVETYDIDLRSVDEARRAFIYSEILTRKYE